MTAISIPESDFRELSSRWQHQLGAYHDLLATNGMDHGLIGPREGDRLWERHLANCAVVAAHQVNLVPEGANVVDIGSGAGLPGLVWALTRPDLDVTLIEPLRRRTDFLQAAVEQLGVGERVTVVRGKALDVAPLSADVVTSRAVTALPALLEWSLRHCREAGSVVAIKGGRASQELSAARESIRTIGGEGRVLAAEVITIDVEGIRESQVPTGPLATVVVARYG